MVFARTISVGDVFSFLGDPEQGPILTMPAQGQPEDAPTCRRDQGAGGDEERGAGSPEPLSTHFHLCRAFFVVPPCGLPVSPPTRALGAASPTPHLLTPWGCSRVAGGLGISGGVSGSGSLLCVDRATPTAWASFLWASPASPLAS